MPLPQKVLDTLSREPPQTPGWSVSLLSFSGGLLFIVLAIYFGLAYGYEPYVQAQVDALNTKLNMVANSISPAQAAQLATFYSQITNLKDVLASRTELSQLFSWLEKNTEANVYYSSLQFSGGSKISLQGSAVSEADVNEQAAIFESSPQVSSVNLSTVSFDDNGKVWKFSVTLDMKPFSSTTP